MLADQVDLLVLGGLGVDIATSVPALPLPLVDSMIVPVELRVGNTGAGVALAARAIGLTVAMVDTIGDDPAGQVIATALARADIPTVLRPDPRGTRRSISLIDRSGRRMALYDPRGAWSGPPPLTGTELVALAGRARHVHVSIMDWMIGLLPGLAGLGVPVSTDLHDWDGSADYQRPFAAAAEMVFVSGSRLPAVDAALAGILEFGRATLAVATLGDEGARWLSTDGATAMHVPVATPPGPVVDTNGAGDAFAAGLIAGRLRGWPVPEAARYAAAVAAAACTHHGMEYPPGLLPPVSTWPPSTVDEA